MIRPPGGRTLSIVRPFQTPSGTTPNAPHPSAAHTSGGRNVRGHGELVEEKFDQLARRIASRSDPRDAVTGAAPGLVGMALNREAHGSAALSRTVEKLQGPPRDGRRQLHEQHGLTRKQETPARVGHGFGRRHRIPAASNSAQRFSKSTLEGPRMAWIVASCAAAGGQQNDFRSLGDRLLRGLNGASVEPLSTSKGEKPPVLPRPQSPGRGPAHCWRSNQRPRLAACGSARQRARFGSDAGRATIPQSTARISRMRAQQMEATEAAVHPPRSRYDAVARASTKAAMRSRRATLPVEHRRRSCGVRRVAAGRRRGRESHARASSAGPIGPPGF